MNQLLDAQIAAWESTTVQNLGPHLSSDASAALWDAVLANRKNPSAEGFSSNLADVLSGHSQRVTGIGQDAVRQLAQILIPAATPAAKE